MCLVWILNWADSILNVDILSVKQILLNYNKADKNLENLKLSVDLIEKNNASTDKKTYFLYIICQFCFKENILGGQKIQKQEIIC